MNWDAELPADDATWMPCDQLLWTGPLALLTRTRVRLPPLTASVHAMWQSPSHATAGAAFARTSPGRDTLSGGLMLWSTAYVFGVGLAFGSHRNWNASAVIQHSTA